MAQRQRQQEILAVIEQNGESSVEELAGRFGVSEMTIRRDLQNLAENGRVTRTHGGAAPTGRVSFEFEFLQRRRSHEAAKRAIAAAAAELVEDGQKVMLDSGTTTLMLAEFLRGKKRLTVITSSLPIASALQYSPENEVLLLGGFLRHDSPDLIGPLTEANCENLRADIAFIGADGIDLTGQVFNESLAVGRMLAKMAAASKRVYAVADSSKIDKTALSRFGSISEWEGLITDSGVDRQAAAALKKAGVTIFVAGRQKS